MATANPNKDYHFVDENGNEFYSQGDNGYVQQAISEGIPISVNSKGEWFTSPYIEDNGDGTITSYIPDWFRDTDEYSQWKETIDSVTKSMMTDDYFNNLSTYISGLGDQARVRTSLTNEAKNYGITDPNLQNKYVNDIIAVASEGAGYGDASIDTFSGTGQTAAEIARSYQSLSKEDLDRSMQWAYDTLNSASDGTWKGSQNDILAAAEQSRILNYVDENYSQFGSDNEFQGLLEPSFWQNLNASIDASMANLTFNSVFGLPVRVLDWATEGLGVNNGEGIMGDTYEEYLSDLSRDPTSGGALGNLDQTGSGSKSTAAAQQWGAFVGTLETLGATVGVTMATQGIIQPKLGSSAVGTALEKISVLSRTGGIIADTLVTDFVMNDLPMDIFLYINDASQNGWNWSEAWESDTETQKLWGIPFVSPNENGSLTNEYGVPNLTGFGPDVPAGLKYNIIGDLTLDFAPKIISATLGAVDNLTGGYLARLKEKAAITNMKIQESIEKIPVLGDAVVKTVNFFVGAEDAEYIRAAKKASIAEGSTDAYVKAQTILTYQNHGGAEAVSSRFKSIIEETGVRSALENLQKNASNYGGMGKTSVTYNEIKNAQSNAITRTLEDSMPIDVKNGLLDIQRLSELKGEEINEGGLVNNSTRTKEIAELESRVNSLPQEIKDFASQVHEANIQVNKMMEDLGLTQEGVTDMWLQDPRFENYMARQTLTRLDNPKGRVGAPDEQKILTASRTGKYDRAHQVDPLISLALKVEAIGKAWIYNERVKSVAAFANSTGSVVAGQAGMEAAQKLSDVTNKIETSRAYRDALDYDTVLSTINSNIATVSNAFNHINDILNLPNTINAKSVYLAGQDPSIKDFTTDFTVGNIRLADGLTDGMKLSDIDVSDIMTNVYSFKKIESSGGEEGVTKITEATKNGTGGGVTSRGVPYTFEVKDGEIVSLKEATSAQELSDSVAGLAGSYSIAPETVSRMGAQNLHAINRALLFYRDNLPTIAEKIVFKLGSERPGIYGWCPPTPSSLSRTKNGKLTVDEFEVYVNRLFYAKGKEQKTLDNLKNNVASRFHPPNSDDLSNVFIHENGHTISVCLTLLEMNEKIQNGEGGSIYKLDTLGPSVAFQFYNRDMEEKILYSAMKRVGFYGPDGNHHKLQTQRKTISRYAWYPSEYATKNSETIAEAFVDYAFNGRNASEFSRAIVSEFQSRLSKFATAANPLEAMSGNGITAPKGLVNKEGQYNFPNDVKTTKQQAKWLNKWREDNPYLTDGIFTVEQYKKANMWDSYFSKEISARDSYLKSEAPNKLITKNAEFLDNLNANSAEMLVKEIKDASVNGFDTDLATLVLSRNYADSSDALDRFIVKQVESQAEEIAKKMPGGLTEDNLAQAKITLWSDEAVKRDVVNMLSSLVPGTKQSDILNSVDNLFTKQANGYAEYSALPLDTQDLVAQQKKYHKQIYESNKWAKKVGEKVDTDLVSPTGKNYVGEVTQVITYKQNGQDVYVVVNDPVIASVLKRPMDYKVHGQVAEMWNMTAEFVSRAYRIGTTTINPAALLNNILRDPLQAAVTSEFNPLNIQLDPRYFYRSLRLYGLDDATITKVLDQINTAARTETLTQEMRGVGIAVPGSRTYSNKIQQMSNKFEKLNDSWLMRMAESPLDAWEGFFRNQVGQQAFVRNYKRTRNIDKALGMALLEASNATTNFSHAVAGLKNVTSTIPYLSSAINGARSFGVLFTVDPIGMITRISAGFMVPMMAITAWNLSSEERRKTYKNLPEWYKSSHIVLLDPDGQAFSIPIPDEISNYATLARNLIEYTQEQSPYALQTILARGVFGMLPVETDGFFTDTGEINIGAGVQQLVSGLTPQLVTAAYEFIARRDTYTGQSYASLDGLNQAVNLLGNIFGTGIKQAFNDIFYMIGQPNTIKVGKTTMDTIARNLFGMGFNQAAAQFMEMIGDKPTVDPETGKETKATGLWADNEKLQAQIKSLDTQIAVASDEEKESLEERKNELISEFTNKVANMAHNYMNLYSQTGGLEDWQKNKLVQLLTLGDSWSSADESQYQSGTASEAYLNERSLAQQRYVDAGLPAGADISSLARRESGSYANSIEVQAALNKIYGTTKQATYDFTNAAEDAGLDDLREQYYSLINEIYDSVDNVSDLTDDDYDLIERIQARYLQAVDAVMVPILNQYGTGVLNNNGFINEVKSYVNGFVPSNDWKQSTKNAKYYLSTKEFPLTEVNTKKWLIQRYTSEMKDRGLASDDSVTKQLESIKSDLDSGKQGSAKGKIESLFKGVQNANYYISQTDMNTLYGYYNMVK